MSNFVTISNARNNLPSLVKKVGGAVNRYLITVNNEPKAVLLSFDELESLEETAEVLSTKGAEKSVKLGLSQVRKGQGTDVSEL